MCLGMGMCLRDKKEEWEWGMRMCLWNGNGNVFEE